MHNNILNSSILSDLKEINELMTLCEFPVDQKWRLIYKGSKDGFKASDFHSKCDNKPNTLVVIKSSNGNVFGGYTEQSWSNTDTVYERIDKPDPNAFVFSLINKDNRPLKVKCSPNNGIRCSNSCGPIFGGKKGKSDLVIGDNSDLKLDGFSYFGHYYIHPDYDYEYESVQAESFLAGSHKFQVSEIEVYSKK
jgi:BTB/POZ domain-containing protein KCTD9